MHFHMPRRWIRGYEPYLTSHISRICLIIGGKQLQMAVISSLCTTAGRGITNK